ncbi:hypothetical protein [Kitasatospora mediocidica]|uniref:hypothetical protein n=1 Tax=Kitasatospora mediocidica TaxID=58352 RepID=UPI000B2AB675|nr:hypothetical protein [Kitasatospora mediocidica]
MGSRSAPPTPILRLHTACWSIGLFGALVAVPAAVALGLVLDAYVFPRTDNA